MLAPSLRQKAKDAAIAIQNKVWDQKLPVRSARIISDLRVSMPHGTFSVVYEPLPQGVSASSRAYFDEAKQRFVCAYSFDEIIYRQNFALAHGLGHVVLAHVNDPAIVKENHSYHLDSDDDQEAMACVFALELLLPEKLLRQLWPAVKSVQQAAEAFLVATPAITHRVKALGLLR